VSAAATSIEEIDWDEVAESPVDRVAGERIEGGYWKIG